MPEKRTNSTKRLILQNHQTMGEEKKKMASIVQSNETPHYY